VDLFFQFSQEGGVGEYYPLVVVQPWQLLIDKFEDLIEALYI
jgi:hypothetical protein